MSNAHTFGIGSATGIISAITAIAGCVIGWNSYLKSQKIKARDLRLELRKETSSLRFESEMLPALLNQARTSRSAVNAAMGIGPQSSSALNWIKEVDSDLQALHDLASELPDARETYQNSSQQDLEDSLVKIHSLKAKTKRLRDKYEKELASDEKNRDRIRTNMHSKASS